jgi:histidinol-phosphate aminotransferase
MSRLERLIRPDIATLVPYSSARDEYALDENQKNSLVLLDANENALGSILGEGLNRYPDPYQRRLKAEIGGVMSINPDFMFLGNGSDEAIDLLIKLFCEPGRDEIMILPPTYGMYQVNAAIYGVTVHEVPLDEMFQVRTGLVLKACSANTKLLFICSPNNPTGNVMSRDAIAELAESFPGYIVVDEAYIDFCPEKSVLPLINEYDNLIILRTFSKAWGLAGIRLGIAVAQKEVIEALNKIKSPYNINSLTERAARKALRMAKQTKKIAEMLVQERGRLQELLLQCPVVEKVYPSDANFLLVKVKNSRETYQYLAASGIIVRDRGSQMGLENCLRVTVGKKEENDKLYRVLLRQESV